APYSPILAVHSLGISLGILVAWIFVIPIANPQRAVRPDLFADWTKPAIGGREKIFFGDGFEAGAVRNQTIVVDGILVDVAHEHVAAVFHREIVTLIDANAAIGGHVMFVVDDRR